MRHTKLLAMPTPAPAAADLGDLLSPAEIAERFFRGKPSARWVRDRFAPWLDRAVLIRNSPHYYEADVREIVPQLRGAA